MMGVQHSRTQALACPLCRPKWFRTATCPPSLSLPTCELGVIPGGVYR